MDSDTEPVETSGEYFRHPPYGTCADWDEIKTGKSVEQQLIESSTRRVNSLSPKSPRGTWWSAREPGSQSEEPYLKLPPKGANADWDEIFTGVSVEFWTPEMHRAETYEEANNLEPHMRDWRVSPPTDA